MEDDVEIEDVTVVRETDKALLCEIEGEEVWIPKSQIRDESEVYSLKSGKEPGKLIISGWLAKDKGYWSE